MSDTAAVRKPPNQISRLTTQQKLDLIGCIWDSIHSDELPPLSDAERDELDRRLQQHRLGKVKAIPWSKARRRLRVGLQRKKR